MSNSRTAAQQKSTKTGNRSASSGAAQNQTNKAAQAKSDQNKTDQNKAAQAKTANQNSNRTAERGRIEHNRTAQKERTRGTTARSEEQRGSARTAQQRNLNGLQGNAAMPMQGGGSGGVQLSEQQRTHIRDTVIDAHGVPRLGRADFDIRVGTLVPRRDVRVVPVPGTLVRIEPRWRGYRYFVYNDEIVIVDPHTMRIVAVVEA
jgi:hypothetical protein